MSKEQEADEEIRKCNHRILKQSDFKHDNAVCNRTGASCECNILANTRSTWTKASRSLPQQNRSAAENLHGGVLSLKPLDYLLNNSVTHNDSSHLVLHPLHVNRDTRTTIRRGKE